MVNANSPANEGMLSNAPAQTRHEDCAGATNKVRNKARLPGLPKAGKLKATLTVGPK